MRADQEPRSTSWSLRKRALPVILVTALVAVEGCTPPKQVAPKTAKKETDGIGAVVQPIAKRLAAQAIALSHEGRNYYFQVFSPLDGPHRGQTELHFKNTEPDGEVDDIEVYLAGTNGPLKASSVVEVEIGFGDCVGSTSSPNCGGTKEELIGPSIGYEGVSKWASESRSFTLPPPYNEKDVQWGPVSDTVRHLPKYTSAVTEGRNTAQLMEIDFRSIMSIAEHSHNASSSGQPVLT